MTIKNKTAQQLGFWSAVSSAISSLWFSITFGLYQPILYAPWPGIQAYANAFEVEPFFAWIIPCFLLTFCFFDHDSMSSYVNFRGGKNMEFACSRVCNCLYHYN